MGGGFANEIFILPKETNTGQIKLLYTGKIVESKGFVFIKDFQPATFSSGKVELILAGSGFGTEYANNGYD